MSDMDFEAGVNVNEIMRCFDLAWQEEMDVVGRAFEQAIEGDYYDWDGETVRDDGSIASSPRNIVNRHELLDSQYQVSLSKEDTEFGWDASHAAANHNGFRRVDGSLHRPRAWTQKAIRGDLTAPIEYQNPDALLDVPKDFAARLDKYLKSLN